MSDFQLDNIAEQMLQDVEIAAQTLNLQFGGCAIRIQSNSQALLKVLAEYFKHLPESAAPLSITVTAIESPVLDLGIDFNDWKREAGKSGRKDAYFDFDNSRLVSKVRTGMLFLQSKPYKIVVGPCLDNCNQVINFINSQYMNWLQQRGWLICHAAAVVYQKRSYAVAGFSGGGKSTFMLNLLDQQNVKYLTNDRLFIRREVQRCQATGIAKLPRINPGTIVNNPRLHSLITEKQRNEFLNMPRQQLWDVDEKYDVDIESVYGSGRIEEKAPLCALIILNWQLNSDQAFSVHQVDLNMRPDLLSAVMKSPGPFYQDHREQFIYDTHTLDESHYLEVLSGIRVFEVSGEIDFQALQIYFNQNIVQE